jgi:uncharacterized protein
MAKGDMTVNLSVFSCCWFRKFYTVFKFCNLLLLVYINSGQACPVENKHIEITVNGHALTTEFAANLDSHMCGLAFRHVLPADQGMLFAYAQDQIIGFWMKNTFIPLSIAFLDVDGEILEIHNMDPDTPTRRYISSIPARYALEVNQGWFEKNGVVTGDRAELAQVTGPEVFRYDRTGK